MVTSRPVKLIMNFFKTGIIYGQCIEPLQWHADDVDTDNNDVTVRCAVSLQFEQELLLWLEKKI